MLPWWQRRIRGSIGRMASTSIRTRYAGGQEIDRARRYSFPLPFLGAPCHKVLITPAVVTRHQLSVSVIRILLSAKPLATAVASVSFAFPRQEGINLILGVHEGLA